MKYYTVLSYCPHIVGLQAAVSALKQFPAVNAVIDGDDIIYRDYVDISIAVGTAKVRVSNAVYILLSSCELWPRSICYVADCFDLLYVQGLVVPVIRGADHLNFAQIEKTINVLGKKANDGSISIDDMAGGTFTISNGGVYGSLISTPIINPPQVRFLSLQTHSNFPFYTRYLRKRKDFGFGPLIYIIL